MQDTRILKLEKITFLDTKNYVENNFIPFMVKVIDYKNKYVTYYDVIGTKDELSNLVKQNKRVIKQFSNPEVVGDFNNIIRCYSDGGVVKGKGVYPDYSTSACFILNKDDVHSIVEGNENTTSNYGELKAGYNALKYALDNTTNEKIILGSDSQYFLRGFAEYYHNWKKNGYKNNNGDDIANKELWMKVFELKEKSLNRVYVRFIKGHEDTFETEYFKYNYLCDYECNLKINEWLTMNGLKTRKLKPIDDIIKGV